MNQSIIIWTRKTKSLLPSLYPPGQLPARRAFQLGERPSWAGGKRESRVSRDLAKRGEGRFSEAYVFFIMDSLVNRLKHD
jgi:hypothetical protein